MSKVACLLTALFALVSFNTNGQIDGIKIAGDTCTELTLDIQVTGTSSSPYFFWNFGDPASGTNDTVTITGAHLSAFPTHTFSAPGIYTICCSFQEPDSPIRQVCRTVSIGLCCNGSISTSDSCLQNTIPFSIVTGANILSVVWDFGDPASGSANTATGSTSGHKFSATGNYTVTATVTATCGLFTLNTNVSIVNCGSTPCTGNIVYQDSCKTSNTLFRVVSARTINAVEWNFGDPGSGLGNVSNGNNALHVYAGDGSYNVRAIVTFDCGIDTLFATATIVNCNTTVTSDCYVIVPDVFTPNNDGKNDFISIVNNNCPFQRFEMNIYNRWGQRVFTTSDPANKWDGKFNGIKCDVGVYSYYLRYQLTNNIPMSKKGNITLIE